MRFSMSKVRCVLTLFVYLSTGLFSDLVKGEPKVMSIVDYVVDVRALVGVEVTIDECRAVFASAETVGCIGTTSSTRNIGGVVIDGKTLEREGLRMVIRNCFDHNNRPECVFSVTGVVKPIMEGVDVWHVTNATLKRRLNP